MFLVPLMGPVRGNLIPATTCQEDVSVEDMRKLLKPSLKLQKVDDDKVSILVSMDDAKLQAGHWKAAGHRAPRKGSDRKAQEIVQRAHF